MVSVDIVHGLSGHCPWTEWTMSMDSVDIFHGLSGHCSNTPAGQCPLSPWTFYRQECHKCWTRLDETGKSLYVGLYIKFVQT